MANELDKSRCIADDSSRDKSDEIYVLDCMHSLDVMRGIIYARRMRTFIQ